MAERQRRRCAATDGGGLGQDGVKVHTRQSAQLDTADGGEHEAPAVGLLLLAVARRPPRPRAGRRAGSR